MYSFTNDYSEGAHESILKALLESNLKQSGGYGLDEYCEKAKDILKNVLKNDKIDIHFIPGGTQVNLIRFCNLLDVLIIILFRSFPQLQTQYKYIVCKKE